MVVDELSQEEADRVFHALADATRRDIVVRVLQGEHSVSDLARHYPMSFAAVQKHVVVLERAGLVSKHRRGREQLVRGDVDTLRRAGRLLDQLELLWRARMDRFADLLDAETPDVVEGTVAADTTAPTEPGGPT
jgi:DNA-binding transcriptional ArsR family regulator